MIYYELLREYKRHCSTQEELETLQELDRVTAPITWPDPWKTYQPQGHTG
jgi:hypothetical protein